MSIAGLSKTISGDAGLVSFLVNFQYFTLPHTFLLGSTRILRNPQDSSGLLRNLEILGCRFLRIPVESCRLT